CPAPAAMISQVNFVQSRTVGESTGKAMSARLLVGAVVFFRRRNRIGAGEPAVEVEILAARRAERVVGTARRLAAFRARPARPQRRDVVPLIVGLVVCAGHGQTLAPEAQLRWGLKPSATSSPTVSWSGRPTTL